MKICEIPVSHVRCLCDVIKHNMYGKIYAGANKNSSIAKIYNSGNKSAIWNHFQRIKCYCLYENCPFYLACDFGILNSRMQLSHRCSAM